MREVAGDIFRDGLKYTAICLTTNGTVRTDGRNVMGRGTAAQAVRYWTGIEYVIGRYILRYGNHVQELTRPLDPNRWGIGLKHVVPCRVFTVPVKTSWKKPAEPDLIERSLLELRTALPDPAQTVVLPRPGCGAGGLEWRAVRPIVERLLPEDRFIVMERP